MTGREGRKVGEDCEVIAWPVAGTLKFSTRSTSTVPEACWKWTQSNGHQLCGYFQFSDDSVLEWAGRHPTEASRLDIYFTLFWLNCSFGWRAVMPFPTWAFRINICEVSMICHRLYLFCGETSLKIIIFVALILRLFERVRIWVFQSINLSKPESSVQLARSSACRFESFIPLGILVARFYCIRCGFHIAAQSGYFNGVLPDCWVVTST